MLNLIRLELKKNRLNGYFYAFIISTLVVCVLSLAIVGTEAEEIANFPIQEIYLSMIGIIFLIIEGTMLAGIVIEEYADKTITLMYQYPIARKKIHAAKLLTIYGITAVSLMLAHLFLNGVLFLVFNYIDYFAQFAMSLGNFGDNLVRYALVSLYYPIIGFIPLVVGMKRKTSRATIITSVIMVTIVGSNNGGNSILSYAFAGAALALVGLLITIYSLRKVNTEDVL